MSSRRSIAWLIFLVALATAGHVFLTVRGVKGGSVAEKRVLAAAADRALDIEFVRSDASSAILVRSGEWKLVSPFRAAVAESVVMRLVDALAFAPVSDVLTAAEMHRLGRGYADFGLERPQRLRRGHDGTVSFGGVTPAGDGVYATSGSSRCVCVVPTNVFAAIDVSVDALRRREILPRPADRVVSIDIRRPAGKFVRVGLKDGVWRMTDPQDAPASTTRISELLAALSAARITRFVWPTAADCSSASASSGLLAGYGLDSESALTVTLKGADGVATSVSFGKTAEPGLVHALVQDGGAIAVIDAKMVEWVLSEADSLVDLRLFPYEESAVQTLSVADGETVYLVARTADGSWRIDSPVSAAADSDTVHALVKGILSLRSTEQDPNGLLVSVMSNAVPIGVSRDALLVQHRLDDLRSKVVLKLPADRIRRLSVTVADGRQEAAVWDSEKRTWILTRPENGELNGLALAGVLATLDPLMATSVVRLRVAASEVGNFGLENPSLKIAVDPLGEGAVRRNILIGSKAPDGGYYATVGSADAVFVLSPETVRALAVPFVTAPTVPAP